MLSEEFIKTISDAADREFGMFDKTDEYKRALAMKMQEVQNAREASLASELYGNPWTFGPINPRSSDALRGWRPPCALCGRTVESVEYMEMPYEDVLELRFRCHGRTEVTRLDRRIAISGRTDYLRSIIAFRSDAQRLRSAPEPPPDPEPKKPAATFIRNDGGRRAIKL